MEWQDTPPTDPGNYWCFDGERIFMTEFVEYSAGLLIGTIGRDTYELPWFGKAGYQWMKIKKPNVTSFRGNF